MLEQTESGSLGSGETKILIAEADGNESSRLESAFSGNGHGYKVYTAQDGSRALLQMGLVQPDLILLDVSMPDGEGWVTLDRIRELSTVPVIALSAVDDPRITVESLERGADDVIAPGPGVREVDARVRALLRRSRNGRSPD